MKNILIGSLLIFSFLACKTGNQNTVDVHKHTDTIEVVADSANVSDSLEQAQSALEEQNRIERDYAQSLEKDYIKEQHVNDSIQTVITKLDYQIKQYTDNQKLAKDYTTQAINKKLSNAWLKQKMIETINKPVKKYVGEEYKSELIKPTGTPSVDIDTYKLKVQSLQIERVGLTDESRKKASQLLHKKMIHTNAQFYLNITIKNSSQDKFLKGWMRRALSQ